MLKQAGVRAVLALATLFAAACEQAAQNEEETTLVDSVADSVAALSPVELENLPEGVDRAQMETGLRAYLVCSVCHGTDGLGTQLGPSLRDSSWIHIDGSPGSIARIIESGVANPQEFPIPMPAMGGGQFEPDEFAALVAYVHALSQS